MSALANGSKGFEKYRDLFREDFVFLNVYCNSVAEEHDPRGPDGPFQFNDRSVPVLVIKKWTGETLVHQLGFTTDPQQGPRSLGNYVDRAVKANGPVVAPKALRPLIKACGKGENALAKGQTSKAITEFLKVRKAAAKKKFEEPPAILEKAEARLAELTARAEADFEAAATESDSKKARKLYQAVARTYGTLPGMRKRVQSALKALPK